MIDFDALPAGTTGVIQIDLGQLAANWQALRDEVLPARCGAVVKANGYGLGADRVVPALANAGCQTFFVATLSEAREVRGLAPSATIFVLDGVLPGSEAAFLEIDAVPVLSNLEEVGDWSAYARQHGTTLPAALHVDTGLNRLGLPIKDIRQIASQAHYLDPLKIYLVMSHLASADEPQNAQNQAQLNVFEGLLPLLPTVATSIAASDGLMLGKPFHGQLVRPGYALYGGQASQGQATPVKPVVSVYARVLQVADLAPGQSVGYSATYKPSEQRKIATIAAGYADGILRSASASNDERGGQVAFAGQTAPIVGRVSMDLTTVDVTDFEDGVIKRGMWAEIVGPTISLEQAGAHAGTIGYEILTSLSRRFHRIYTGEERISA